MYYKIKGSERGVECVRESLVLSLSKITEEEKKILSGETINKAIYTSGESFDIDSRAMLSLGKYIAIRTHTRFAQFPPHSHNYVEIMYVLKGEITHIIDEKEIVMQEGDFLFMNQHAKHSVKTAGEGDIGVNFIILPEFFDIPLAMMKNDKKNPLAEFLIGTFGVNAKKPQYLHFKTAGNFEIENLMENIISMLTGDKKNDETISQFTLGLVFLHLLNNVEQIADDSCALGNDILTQASIEYINKYYKTATLSEFAKSMRQSVANMSKIIKKSTGCTFSELLMRKRFSQAVIFLVETDMSVSEIIANVGYENSSYFYNTFREKYGESPKEYRKKHKSDKIRI